LLAEGVRELNLISQDTTYYGLDLRPNPGRAIASPDRFTSAVNSLSAKATTLCTLLRELNALPGDFWVRLLYTHPAHWTDDLIETMARCPKVARYVDIPLQHIHENMLERMRRETSREYIVGFPGETEECFQSLLQFIRETKFERLGVFAYSQEAGTRAAAMAGQVPEVVKRRRRKEAMAVQHEIARRVSASWVGRTIKVLVEGEPKGERSQRAGLSSWEHGQLREHETRTSKLTTHRCFIARSEADAPDIDGRVLVRGHAGVAPLPIGEFAEVKVVGHTAYDLIADPVHAGRAPSGC
jgi:ribosomal protein S12 methylthiotransferase